MSFLFIYFIHMFVYATSDQIWQSFDRGNTSHHRTGELQNMAQGNGVSFGDPKSMWLKQLGLHFEIWMNDAFYHCIHKLPKLYMKLMSKQAIGWAFFLCFFYQVVCSIMSVQLKHFHIKWHTVDINKSTLTQIILHEKMPHQQKNLSIVQLHGKDARPQGCQK